MKITTEEIIKIRRPHPDYPVMKVISNRFSPRYFLDEEVRNQDINSIFEAARFAPSGWNYEPWYFYWTKKENRSYEKIISCLTKYNRFAKTAAVLIVACFIKKFEGKKTYYRHDLGASVMSLVLQAQYLGYYCRQMGDFNKNKLVKLLEIDKVHHPFVIIALGKLGDYKNIDDRLLRRELDPRPRKKDFVKKLD